MNKKQLLKSSFSSNMSLLRTSFFMAKHIAKVKKPFNIGEKMILSAAKDICHELWGEAAVQKVVYVPLLDGTITRQINEIEKDIEAQLLERITGSLSDWLYSLQPKMEKLYTVSKNKMRSWLWLSHELLIAKFRLKFKKVSRAWKWSALLQPCSLFSVVSALHSVCVLWSSDVLLVYPQQRCVRACESAHGWTHTYIQNEVQRECSGEICFGHSWGLASWAKLLF